MRSNSEHIMRPQQKDSTADSNVLGRNGTFLSNQIQHIRSINNFSHGAALDLVEIDDDDEDDDSFALETVESAVDINNDAFEGLAPQLREIVGNGIV